MVEINHRFRAKRQQLGTLKVILLESHGQNPALAVLSVPYSLARGGQMGLWEKSFNVNLSSNEFYCTA